VVLLNADISGWNAERRRQLLADAGDVLRRKVRQNILVIRPLGNASVCFEATMSDDRLAIDPFGDRVRLLEGLLGIALGLLGGEFVP
jgi:hypothetical protein